MTEAAHPTVTESAARLWGRFPPLLRTLIPALGALLLVTIPAGTLISSRFYAFTDDTLRADHERLLGLVGSAFDELIASSTIFLDDLAASDAVKACAANGCKDSASAVFGPELTAKGRSASYIELGFIDLTGHETGRLLLGAGGTIDSPGDASLFRTDPTALLNAAAGQPYIFPIARDFRLSPTEPYQEPVLRAVVPVYASGVRQGYVTAVILLDNFFNQEFAATGDQDIFLLDTDHCLVATSDSARRTEVYKTWNDAPDKTCYRDLELQDWDVTLQRYHDMTLSTRVIHGALSSSGQTWTIVVQQPTSAAYAQASALRALLVGTYAITVLVVALVIVGSDRAAKQLERAEYHRKVAHARDTRFNPYVVGVPVEDPARFFGRTSTLARVIGAGVMGGENVIVVGDRQIGKTSLLCQVERRLRDRRVSDPQYDYWPVRFNAQGIPAESFYATVIGYVRRETGAPPSAPIADRPEAYTWRDFRTDLNGILKALTPAGHQARIVLLLDNIDPWFSGSSGYDP
ncbi:MAG TPA: ATP-binding protein, partial [Aggregatilineales bacterium]|nr:ATP-binding protein [Aggregatilineales bacterium]